MIDIARITTKAESGIIMSEAGIQTTWMKRPGSVWRLIAGWICIGVGLLGLILPVIPGIPLLILGLVMLSTQHRWAHSALVWVNARFQKQNPER